MGPEQLSNQDDRRYALLLAAEELDSASEAYCCRRPKSDSLKGLMPIQN